MNVEQKPQIDEKGTQRFYNEKGQLHRDNDLPAIIRVSGTQLWYQNDKLHRDNDMPAIVRANGNKHWYKNGIRYTVD